MRERFPNMAIVPSEKNPKIKGWEIPLENEGEYISQRGTYRQTEKRKQQRFDAHSSAGERAAQEAYDHAACVQRLEGWNENEHAEAAANGSDGEMAPAAGSWARSSGADHDDDGDESVGPDASASQLGVGSRLERSTLYRGSRSPSACSLGRTTLF